MLFKILKIIFFIIIWELNFSFLFSQQEVVKKVLSKEEKKIKTCKTIPAITEAYNLYLEGKYIFKHRQNHTDIKESKNKLSNAMALDEELLPAHMLYAEVLICEGEFYNSLSLYQEILKQYLESFIQLLRLENTFSQN